MPKAETTEEQHGEAAVTSQRRHNAADRVEADAYEHHGPQGDFAVDKRARHDGEHDSAEVGGYY